MPKRMTRKERIALLEAVKFRDGDICTLCLEMPVKEKTLDHVNGKQRDNHLDNLVLLCRSCNTAEGNRARSGQRLLTPDNVQCWRKRAHEALSKIKGQAALLDTSGSRVPLRVSVREQPGVDRRGWGTAEEAANQIMEPSYRLWLYRWVRQYGFISKADAIDAGAEHLERKVGRASQQTVERYFRKAISSEGWLVERRGENNEPAWVFRPGFHLGPLEAELVGRMKTLGPVVPPPIEAPEPEPAGTVA